MQYPVQISTLFTPNNKISNRKSHSNRSATSSSINFRTIFKKRNQTIKNLQHQTHNQDVLSEQTMNLMKFKGSPTNRSFSKTFSEDKKIAHIIQADTTDTKSNKDQLIKLSTPVKSTPITKDIKQRKNELQEIKKYVQQMKNGKYCFNQKTVSAAKKKINDSSYFEDDQKRSTCSRISTKSNANDVTKLLNRSEISNKSMYADAAEDKQTEIKMLEAKVENLIKNKLQLIRSSTLFTNKRNSSTLNSSAKISKSGESTAIDRELDSLLKKIKMYAVKEEELEKLSLQDLSQKIQMIEKIIACQNIESEKLKEQYFNFKNKREMTTSYRNKKILLKEIDQQRAQYCSKKLAESSPTKKYTSSLSKNKNVINFSSSSKQFYKRPSKEYYIYPQQKNNSFSLNRQPFPRSIYSTQYLNYGNIPIYSYKPTDSHINTEITNHQVSNYKHEFKEKVAKNINFKDLDCFVNKFKDVKISFMEVSKKSAYEFKKDKKHHQMKKSCELESVNMKSVNKSTLLEKVKTEHIVNEKRTQNQRQYIWHSPKANISEKTNLSSQDEGLLQKAKIKDKNLNELKNLYKHCLRS